MSTIVIPYKAVINHPDVTSPNVEVTEVTL